MHIENLIGKNPQLAEILTQIKRGADAVFVIQSGFPPSYVVDAGTFDRMRRKLELFEDLSQSEHDVSVGHTITDEEAREHLNEWLK